MKILRAESALKGAHGQSVSKLHNVSDITDPHALQLNYLEKSQADE